MREERKRLQEVRGSDFPVPLPPGAISDVVPREQNTTNIYDVLKDGWMALSH